MATKLTTYYLETLSPNELNKKAAPVELLIMECQIDVFEFNRFLYNHIGTKWQWNEKNIWNGEQWKAYVETNKMRTWVAYFKGTIAGYCDLRKEENGNIEISNFGLVDRFIGKGLGGYFLSEMINHAWTWGATRVCCHTCSDDHQNALSNYKNRGMSLYKTETS